MGSRWDDPPSQWGRRRGDRGINRQVADILAVVLLVAMLVMGAVAIYNLHTRDCVIPTTTTSAAPPRSTHKEPSC